MCGKLIWNVENADHPGGLDSKKAFALKIPGQQ